MRKSVDHYWEERIGSRYCRATSIEYLPGCYLCSYSFEVVHRGGVLTVNIDDAVEFETNELVVKRYGVVARKCRAEQARRRVEGEIIDHFQAKFEVAMDCLKAETISVPLVDIKEVLDAQLKIDCFTCGDSDGLSGPLQRH